MRSEGDVPQRGDVVQDQAAGLDINRPATVAAQFGDGEAAERGRGTQAMTQVPQLRRPHVMHIVHHHRPAGMLADAELQHAGRHTQRLAVAAGCADEDSHRLGQRRVVDAADMKQRFDLAQRHVEMLVADAL